MDVLFREAADPLYYLSGVLNDITQAKNDMLTKCAFSISGPNAGSLDEKSNGLAPQPRARHACCLLPRLLALTRRCCRAQCGRST